MGDVCQRGLSDRCSQGALAVCGITGIVDLHGKRVNREILKLMNDSIAHRGPDGEGFYCEGHVALAHRRLAIIDPRLGIQPFSNEEEDIILVYNGEIYNYEQIRSDLASHYSFSTDSDTEVLLRAYQHFGMDCLRLFRGMFAFALYDMKKNLVFLVRDRVGIKPLYYSVNNGKLIFASELQALLHGGLSKKINHEALVQFFRYQYIPAPHTIYQDSFKLEPGHFLTLDLNSSRIEKTCYWKLKVAVKHKDDAVALEELNALLDDIARLYIKSDVPFGAFLSGGVDSSLVTALMAKQLKSPVKTISIGFNEEEHSELPYAETVSKVLNTDHCARLVTAKAAIETLQKIVRHFGEPFADSSAIPTYYVSMEAAKQVKMVLSGDGGDELFAGYNSYRSIFHDISNPLPVPRALLRLIERLPPAGRLQRWAARNGMSPQEKQDEQRIAFTNSELRALFNRHIDIPQPISIDIDIEGNADEIITFQAQDFLTYMVDDVLTKVDRMSMANSLEVRVPLLDHKLVELAFSLPTAMKLRYDANNRKVVTKHILKQSAGRFFDEAFLNREKRGFGIPIIEWCKGPFFTLIEGSLLDKRNPVYEFLDYFTVSKIVTGFRSGDSSLVAKLWFIFVFDQWFQCVHNQHQ